MCEMLVYLFMKFYERRNVFKPLTQFYKRMDRAYSEKRLSTYLCIREIKLDTEYQRLCK